MTAQAWIGYVKIRARHAQARFWDQTVDAVTGRIMVQNTDADAFAADLSTFLDTRDLELLEVLDLAEVPASGSPELAAFADTASEPLLFDRLVDAGKRAYCDVAEVERADLPPSDQLWALLDGVAWPDLPQVLAQSGDAHICLYTSTDPQTLAHAPWLVRLAPGSAMYTAIMAQPADAHVGIFLTSDQTISDLRAHLRRYTMIEIPQDPGVPVYFRFYDPRVALDFTSAFEQPMLEGLLGCCSAIYARLSPYCLLPDSARIARPVSPFDDVTSYDDRIARVRLVMPPARTSPRPVSVNQAEYARFQTLQRTKADRMLARQLWGEFPGRDLQDYRDVARNARKAAADFDMKSTIQVTVLARAMMMRGQAFWSTDPDAETLLKRKDILPWQKKDALIKWLINSHPPQEAMS